MRTIKNKQKINAYIMALYIFQFGLIQPIASLVNSQFPIVVFTLFLFSLLIINNGIQIKKYVIYAFIIITLYFLVNSIIHYSDSRIILDGYFEFLLKGFSAFIIASLDTNGKEIYKAFFRIAIINAAIMVFYPFTDFMNSEVNYMRFGYAILPSALMFWLIVFNNRKNRMLWLTIAIFISAITVIYGSRGTIVVFTLFMIIYILSSNKVSFIKKSIITIFASIATFFIVKFNLILIIVEYLLYDLEIRTYALKKVRMALYRGVADASSGRDVIYDFLWGRFLENPLLGNGVFYSVIIRSGGTAHNIFLQILVESGILGMLIWISIWGYCISRKMLKMSNELMLNIVMLIFAVVFGRLMFSSDMWLRPEYWFLLSILINYKGNKSMKIL